jgi:hypothetical protein
LENLIIAATACRDMKRSIPGTDQHQRHACADGEVYEVHGHPKDHAYGIHIRIQHRDGYKTVYAHLAKAIVRKGDRVDAGQLIGRADSTGNSSASHLHLSLKRDGATARRETTYPKDIIDPTSFLVWPASKTPKGPDAQQSPRLGLHLAYTDGLGPTHAKSAATCGAEVVLVSHLEPAGTIDALRTSRRRQRFLVRVTDMPPSDGTTPAHFVAQIAARSGVGTGWVCAISADALSQRTRRRIWAALEGRPILRRLVGGRREASAPGLPEAVRISDAGLRRRRNRTAAETLSFLHQAAVAVRESDWRSRRPPSRQDRVLSGYLLAHPEKEIIVTEAEVGANESGPEDLAIRCVAFREALRGTAVAAVLYRAPGGSTSGEESKGLPWEALMILADGAGVASRSEAFAEAVLSRPKREYSPVAASQSASTRSTLAALGLPNCWRSVSSDARRPSATTSTRPSRKLRTQPRLPSPLATSSTK